MTAKNRKHKSAEGDFHPTPKWLVRQCFDEVLKDINPRSILDPGAGTGRFTNMARRHYPDARIVSLDIDPRFGPWKNANKSLTTKNYLEFNTEKTYDLVIGNPPFSLAEEFIVKSHSIAMNTIFLLRLGFLASSKRVKFFRQYKPYSVTVISNRPSFSGAGADSTDYCFMRWSPYKEDEFDTRLFWTTDVPKEDRR